VHTTAPLSAHGRFFMPVTEDFEKYLKQCDEPALIGLLRALQLRLGTAHEAPDDVDRAAAVMHQLNNLRTMQALARDAFPEGSGAESSRT
jgi:hypothetical protein